MQKEINEKFVEGKEVGRVEGRAVGRAEGKAEGKHDAMIFSIKNLMGSMKLTAEQAMDALGVPMDEQAVYLSKLGK
jgi:predicted transposase YdaD